MNYKTMTKAKLIEHVIDLEDEVNELHDNSVCNGECCEDMFEDKEMEIHDLRLQVESLEKEIENKEQEIEDVKSEALGSIEDITSDLQDILYRLETINE